MSGGDVTYMTHPACLPACLPACVLRVLRVLRVLDALAAVSLPRLHLSADVRWLWA
eukprot:COSAG01_NODE_2110_length_8408_cov_19.542183_5_plen_56_part_00